MIEFEVKSKKQYISVNPVSEKTVILKGLRK